jgi:glycosyltransferase involved in cell wall biosynthesis
VTTTVGIDVRRGSWAPQLGISRYARSLLRAMVEAGSSGLSLRAMDLHGSGRWPERTIAVGGGHGFRDRFVQEQVGMARASRSLDLMHLPWYEGPAWSRCPLVVNLHDLDTLEFASTYSWRFRAYYNSLLRLYIRQARLIIVPSRFTLEAVVARWPQLDCVLIPYGVDNVFRPGEAGARPKTVLYTGGFGYRKRLGDLLESFERVAEAEPQATLVVAGSAPAAFQEAVSKLRAANRVRLTGFVEDQELAMLYREASVVVYPSMLEGFGFPVVEAMASGTPVVAARGGSVPEIAGGAACLVEPGRPADMAEAVLTILRDESLAGNLRDAGVVRARDFTWRRAAEQTLDAYRRALSCP